VSASEKLKALQRLQLLEGRFPSFPEQDDLLAALPQLLAVVEAAEAMPRPLPEDPGPYIYARADELREVAAALAALEEALS
jgi:hypothetical protein